MRKYKVVKDWDYSPDGVHVRKAVKGDVLTLDEDLGTDGVLTDHLEEVDEKKASKAIKGAPENKSGD